MKEYLGKFVTFKYRNRKNYISGFLIDLNDDWTLIKYNPVDYLIDGYMLLKTNYIIKYKRDDDDKFKENVLYAKGMEPTDADKFSLTNIYETLKLVSDKFGAFDIEKKDENACYIGKLIKFDKKKIIMQMIDPDAEWSDTGKFSLKKIRTIQFDTDYINSLLLYNKKL
jgi:hypothetical protein